MVVCLCREERNNNIYPTNDYPLNMKVYNNEVVLQCLYRKCGTIKELNHCELKMNEQE